MSLLRSVIAISTLVASCQQVCAETCDEKITALTFECMGRSTSGTVAAAVACREKAEAEVKCNPQADTQTSTPSQLPGIDPKFLAVVPLSESTISKAGIAVEVGATETKCIAVYKRSVGLISEARAFEQFDQKYLGPVGNLITALKITDQVNKGQHIEAAQEAANTVLDTVVCGSGSNICASWMVGRTLGNLLSDGPKLLGLSDRSVNDWWTDQIADYMNSGPTEDDFRRFEAEARAKIAAARKSSELSTGCKR